MSSQHSHKPLEGALLDPEGLDTGDRLVTCQTCGAHLGIKKALPFPEPTPDYREFLIPVLDSPRFEPESLKRLRANGFKRGANWRL